MIFTWLKSAHFLMYKSCFECYYSLSPWLGITLWYVFFRWRPDGRSTVLAVQKHYQWMIHTFRSVTSVLTFSWKCMVTCHSFTPSIEWTRYSSKRVYHTTNRNVSSSFRQMICWICITLPQDLSVLTNDHYFFKWWLQFVYS